eukprot:TRINITY_DN5401_c0_g2_i1.p1 TRINITY_DN5401_c0_g2~~TRINITY_DN5401_c0_g2_i1.p1  ORF type:complete len:199 (+),score=47.33 TRINITY_DN5401_c0_g2_i1:57-599(+)
MSEVAQLIHEAATVLYSPQSGTADRANADRYLTSLLSRQAATAPVCQAALRVLNESPLPQARFAALQILQKFVVHYATSCFQDSNSVDSQAVEYVRCAAQIYENCWKCLTSVESQFLAAKAAQVIASLATRSDHAGRKSSIQTEVLTLERVIHDVLSVENIEIQAEIVLVESLGIMKTSA